MRINFGKFKDRDVDSLIGDDDGERWLRWVIETTDFSNTQLRDHIIDHILPNLTMPAGKHKSIKLSALKNDHPDYIAYCIEKDIFTFLKHL